MIELSSKPLVDHIELRAALGFRFANRNWRATIKPVRKLDTIHLEAQVRPGADLMAKIDPEPVTCQLLAEELLSNPSPELASALNTLHRSSMKASGLYMPPEPEELRFDHALIAKHPKIFPGGPLSPEGQGWFLACGPGWSSLIDTLCSRIQQHVDGHGGEQVVAAHVKEKFGTLRFAYNLAHDDMRIAGMAEMACAMSLHICEICGAPGGLLRDDGWYRTRCTEHRSMPVGQDS
jgi:hypothetical protein